MYVAQIVRNEEGFRKCSILRLTFILKQVAIQRISRAITSCKQLSAPIIMSSCLMISLSKKWKSTVLSWSLECWSPSTLINLVFEKANHAQSNLALQKHFEWKPQKKLIWSVGFQHSHLNAWRVHSTESPLSDSHN